MVRNVIYFPTINPPENQWFNRVLLYWDKVYSIVPDNIFLNDYMEELIKEDLLQTFGPNEYLNESYLNDKEISNFFNLFLDYVKSDKFPISKDSNMRKYLLRDNSPGIHIEKLDFEVRNMAKELHQIGLATNPSDEWIKVEEYTAKFYMSYLASFVGEFSNINASPITDQSIEMLYHGPNYSSKFQIEKNDLRFVILDNILPAPGQEISLDEIKNFKQRHHDDLLNFRAEIEDELHDLMKIKNISEREYIINDFKEIYNDRINEISEDMNNRGWKNLGKESSLAVIDSFINFATSFPNPIGMGKAAYDGIKAFKDINNYFTKVDDPKLAYAIYVQKELVK